jgi:hypothetical protein
VVDHNAADVPDRSYYMLARTKQMTMSVSDFFIPSNASSIHGGEAITRSNYLKMAEATIRLRQNSRNFDRVIYVLAEESHGMLLQR